MRTENGERPKKDSTVRRSSHNVVSRSTLDSKSKYFSPGRIKPLPSLDEEWDLVDVNADREKPHVGSSGLPTLGKGSTPERSVSLKPPRKKKTSRPYAPPETYAHLTCLPDHLKDNLDVVFCGINPGVSSSIDGHHYAHPTNHFWKCLSLSGFTGPITASEDHTLPEKYNLGLTNLIDRPSAEQSELSKEEMRAAAPRLIAKVGTYKPLIVCFVGKVIWDHVKPYLVRLSGGKGKRALNRPFTYDLQSYKLVYPEHGPAESTRETLFFVVPSTSARVVGHDLQTKAAMFALLRSRLGEVKAKTVDTALAVQIPFPAPPEDSAHP